MSEDRLDDLEQKVELLREVVSNLQKDLDQLTENIESGLSHMESHAIAQAKQEIAEEYSLDEASVDDRLDGLRERLSTLGQKMESQHNLYMNDGHEPMHPDAEDIESLDHGGLIGTWDNKHELMQILGELQELNGGGSGE